MDTQKNQTFKEKDDEMEDEEYGKREKVVVVGLGRRGSSSDGGGGMAPPCCQVEKCGVDLSEAKRYHRRHKVCESHAKALVVIVSGIGQRFCQQCSRFHEVTEFDEAKRSCRISLAGHNLRRRKMASEVCGAGSSRNAGSSNELKENQYNLAAGHSDYSHFHIR